MADSGPLAHSPTLSAAPPRGDNHLEPGAKVGDYIVERFIGAGAMGEVYAGRHPVIGKRVALKILRPELATSAEAAERFTREARAVNQIEHSNVVDVFAIGRLDDGRLYLVMDLVEGRSLRVALVNGPLPIGEAIAILDQIADALDVAHARGVVHRDLKPDNIVLSSSTPPPRVTDPSGPPDRAAPKVYVLDFGIAKLIANVAGGTPIAPGTLTGQGTWLGTPGYMAPEQWSADGAGPASDRYALGAIAFELLAGAPPFAATSVPAMMEQHFRAHVPTLSSRGAVGVPPAVDDVLRKALAKDPAARYATARQMVDALRVAAGTPDEGRRAPRRSRKPWLHAAAGGGLLGVAVVVVIASRGGPAVSPVAAKHSEEVPIRVTSQPSGAQLRIGSEAKGSTPTQLYARPGESLEMILAKPGYLSQRRTLTAGPSGNVLDVRLDEVRRFEGVWRLDTGELRAFERNADQVDVYKLREVAGPRTFFKHYDFTFADAGVAFAADDEIVDERAPNDPQCHVRVRVEYRYDPDRDLLELRREHVDIDIKRGSCVVLSREVKPTTLARVDAPTETVGHDAPAGVPVKRPTKQPPARKAQQQIPLDPKKAKQAKLLETTKAQQNATVKPTAPYTGSKGSAVSFEGQQNAPAPQAQILPPAQAPAPQPSTQNASQLSQQKK